jgi:hypothetical protein
LDEISRQVDEYEFKYGPTDRSDFDGEFYVPAEVRNRVNSSKGSLRIHGGLLTISRSRTFLTLSQNSKTSIHSSTPDLTRSVPNTPGSSHKLSLTSSYDSVLEENEDEGVMIIKKGKDKKKNGKSYNSVQHIFDNVPMRRKSEDFLDKRTSTRSSNSNNNTMNAMQRQQQHVRQSSDQAYRLIPRVKKSNENSFTRQSQMQTFEVKESSNFTASTSKSSASLSSEAIMNYSRWGHVRGSNSFAADLNVSNLSTYSIPRVTLTHQRAQSSEPSFKAGTSRKSLPENRVSSTFVMKHDIKDSTA